MEPEETLKVDIAKIKPLFFDPQFGGSRELEQVVNGMVDAHKRMFRYISQQMSGEEQRAAERETREEFGNEWISATAQLRTTLERLLLMRSDASKAKLLDAVVTLGITDQEIENSGFSGDFKAESYIEMFVEQLATHYEANVQIAQSFGRGAPKGR